MKKMFTHEKIEMKDFIRRENTRAFIHEWINFKETINKSKSKKGLNYYGLKPVLEYFLFIAAQNGHIEQLSITYIEQLKKVFPYYYEYL